MPTNTSDLKKFAQSARRELRQQVAARLEQVLRTDSAELREKSAAIRELQDQISQADKQTVIDRVAYTWFNRFCALRYMDVNRYTRIGVVSPAEGFTQPEILQESKQGYIDEDLKRFVDAKMVFELLNGQRPSSDPQGEAYRLLLVAACNSYNAVMPFLFEKIADYTELLMPVDLLSEHSVLHDLHQELTPEACQDVEVIGWLYQYYISERKDEVFEALKKGEKIEANDIPAATQLFTPHWIVRYLVENSLGRLWLLNRPNSRLSEKMEYYIKPVQEETDFLRVSSPEELKVCDPACGSGHMLTYAFDLLYAIYEEEGYSTTDISRLILEKNLYGIEIDQRSGALAAFALFMKARNRDKRFFSRPVQPNICVLENVTFTKQELSEYATALGRDLFTEPLLETLTQFEHADNFGSLIRPALTDAAFVRQTLEARNLGGNIFLYGVHQRVMRVLEYSEYLAQRYHVVVANPPYMGGKGMNSEMRNFASNSYPNSKSDLFAMFIERNMDIAMRGGFLVLMTPFTWMFLSSYEIIRSRILTENTLASLIRPEYHAFFDSAFVPICAFTLFTLPGGDHKGSFIDLSQFYGANLQPIKTLEAINNSNCGWFFLASTLDFNKIPGAPISYWISDNVRNLFERSTPLSNVMLPRKGIATGDNDRFLRFWYEVENSKTGFPESEGKSGKKWYVTTKGGAFRKWYGNHDYVVNWENDGYEIKNFRNPDGSLKSRPQNIDFFFKEGITWSDITSSQNAFRKMPTGFAFEGRGPAGFVNNKNIFEYILAFLNSKIVSYTIQFLNPTLSTNVGEIARLPFIQKVTGITKVQEIVLRCCFLTKLDWDWFETSWDFRKSPLLEDINIQNILEVAYKTYIDQSQNISYEMQRIEIESNQILIAQYNLQDELTSSVPLEEITLTCNPYYRYGNNHSVEELETLVKADTMKEFISYAVGCMFGRYSLDKPGLVLANQGEGIDDFRLQIKDYGVSWEDVRFKPDEDNAIPVLDGEWFSDDITERFKKFLRVTFGEEHYEENLAFIEDAIGRDIRSYFVKEFYKEHFQMYKKRPIYWMFSSPKGSFNVLIYMHRYQPDTISVILNRYLREFRVKLEARKSYLEQITISASATPREKTAALKEIEKLNKVLEELLVYEREVLFPLATQRIEIDLDDGVKVNYVKFGEALQKIPGL